MSILCDFSNVLYQTILVLSTPDSDIADFIQELCKLNQKLTKFSQSVPKNSYEQYLYKSLNIKPTTTNVFKVFVQNQIEAGLQHYFPESDMAFLKKIMDWYFINNTKYTNKKTFVTSYCKKILMFAVFFKIELNQKKLINEINNLYSCLSDDIINLKEWWKSLMGMWWGSELKKIYWSFRIFPINTYNEY